eukprot:scaffold71012_cov64-Phaeocystis_antarctica.AAC.1
MPQSLQPPCVLEGQLLGLPACQQEYDGVLFVTPYLPPCVVLQTGAHSAGALALAAIGPSVTTIGARARAHASRRTQRSCIRRQSPLAWFSGTQRHLLEPSYPVGYIGSLYLLDLRGWPVSPPPSSDLLVAVFIVVTALLPTSRTVDLFRHDAVFILFLSYPIIAWDAADSRGSLRNIAHVCYKL